MDKKQEPKLEKFLVNYFKEIHKIYIDGDFREESFYPSFKRLIEDCSKLYQTQAGLNVLVAPRKTEAGIPDFRVGKNGEIIGFVEAKPPDADLGEVEDSDQLKRYRDSLPNLILTNFLEFRLYRSGRPVDKVQAGRQFTLRSLKSPPSPEKLDEFFELLENFFSFSTPEIQKSSDLSIELAKKTRFLEHILREELLKENDEVTRFWFQVPILVFAGEKDTYRNCCLIDSMRTMEAAAKKGSAPFELVVYPAAGHVFNLANIPQAFRAEESADAWQRTIKMLSQYQPLR